MPCDCTHPNPHTEEAHKAIAHRGGHDSHNCAGYPCPVETCEKHPAPVEEDEDCISIFLGSYE